MSRYRYEDLSPAQFERLVVDICRALLGRGVRGFADGPDGGRDARFDGVTNDFPSRRAPWDGITIIQAKHTSRYNASYSETEFCGAKGILNTEIPRIRQLAISGNLHHYMLFANRKLTGNADSKIVERIASECGLASSDIRIVGMEEIDDILREHSGIAERHHLELLSTPLRITRDGLAEIIEAMHDIIDYAGERVSDEPVKRTSLERKNKLNRVSDEEIAPLRRRYLKDTRVVEAFLSNPINQELLEKYNEAVEELNCRLPHLIEQAGGFMGAWHKIYDIMVDHEVVLRKNARLVRVMQFYMYWNCDFGRREADD